MSQNEEMFQMSMIVPLGIKPISLKSQIINKLNDKIDKLTMERDRIIELTEEEVIQEEMEKDERQVQKKLSKKLSVKEPKVKTVKEPKVKTVKEPKVKTVKEPKVKTVKECSTGPKKTRTTPAEMKARKYRLVEEFVKENYKVSKHVIDENKDDGYTKFSTEERKQSLTDKTAHFPGFKRIVLAEFLVMTNGHYISGRSAKDTRTEKDYDFQKWSCKKVKEWGVKNPITYNNKEEVLREWYDKWETFDDLFAFLDDDEPCLK